ncbi:MFS transporter [Actinospongicola halichondriae]|uniref:MFS transporter n=1 Tax=Actinospongicola halichondriae TaxID=3236844 RepID=UPI003D4F7DC3
MPAPVVTIEETEEVDDVGLAAYRRTRSDVVEEHDEGEGRFSLAQGPFLQYERTLAVSPAEDGRHAVTHRVEFQLGVGWWWRIFLHPMRRTLRRAGGKSPWWAPPQVLDAQAAAALASLAYLSIVGGYLGTLITQSLTYAADEFGADDGQQASTLAIIRVGVLLSLGIAAWADRNGRRRALLACAAGGCVFTALGAVAPGLLALGATQILARGLSTALGLLIVVVVAEEMPAGARAYGVSLLTMTGGLGAGMVLWILPLVEIDERAWRALYLVPLLFLPLVGATAKLLPESRRFVRRHAVARFAGHGRRLALLAGTTFALAILSTPASQLQNEFLREEFSFSAAQITLFTILTVTPATIGIIVGGRLADTKGKRLIGGIGLGVGAALTAAQFVTTSVELVWTVATIGSIFGGLAVPALAIYGPELFPTALRTKANVVMTILGVGGSVLGLVIVSYLSDRWSLGPAIAVLAVAPLLATLLLIPLYPETANKELEELNPEDDLGVLGTATLRPRL